MKFVVSRKYFLVLILIICLAKLHNARYDILPIYLFIFINLNGYAFPSRE